MKAFCSSSPQQLLISVQIEAAPMNDLGRENCFAAARLGSFAPSLCEALLVTTRFVSEMVVGHRLAVATRLARAEHFEWDLV